jgi:hypothetical protein
MTTSAKAVIAAALPSLASGSVQMRADTLTIQLPSRDRSADAILAALDAAGFVVVPREPTDAMKAVTKSMIGNELAYDADIETAGAIYRAMIAAAEKG